MVKIKYSESLQIFAASISLLIIVQPVSLFLSSSISVLSILPSTQLTLEIARKHGMEREKILLRELVGKDNKLSDVFCLTK